MKYFFYSLVKNFLDSFKGINILFHVLAIFLTYYIVVSGFDWWYLVHMRSFAFITYFRPAIVVGGILPILSVVVLSILGFLTKKKWTQVVSFALVQAILLGSCISSLYKAFTGRVQPNLHDLTTNTSGGFHFGFLEKGIFWGWPSSHTTIAFAMSFVLIQLFPRKKYVVILSLLYAFYIGIGISFSIHWFSEFVAGAILGTIIGIVVGKNSGNTKRYIM